MKMVCSTVVVGVGARERNVDARQKATNIRGIRSSELFVRKEEATEKNPIIACLLLILRWKLLLVLTLLLNAKRMSASRYEIV